MTDAKRNRKVDSVKDTSGAVISSATITLTATGEGTVRPTTSNATGDFCFLDAKAVNHSLIVTGPDFQNILLTVSG